MENWCKMTEQCDINLNMMLPCTFNHCLSALEAMEGIYSFGATPEIDRSFSPIGRNMKGLQTYCFSEIKQDHNWLSRVQT